MLNAFRHHRGGHQTPPAQSPGLPASAQRLSASQRWAFDRRRRLLDPDECSTPFGITEVGIPFGRPRVPDHGEVLNAFRHHRGGHPPRRRRRCGRPEVLNAFRHHRGGHAFVLAEQCGRRLVLNAFRHHRGGHSPRDRDSPWAKSRAQRLSASQRWASPVAGWLWIATAGAQRLSASQRWAFLHAMKCAATEPVLNAFRHHRGGHELAHEASRLVKHVLNAFRHHRGGHTRPHGLAKSLLKLCSTPFGITEVGMEPCSIRQSMSRLGAQRLSASQRWASAITWSMFMLLSGAQRLSASQRWAYQRTVWRSPGG